MVSSKRKGSLFDPIRQCFVSATPEEIVRQKLLQVMITQLGFPKELLAIEKELSELPHLRGTAGLPKRRADVVCFAKGIHPEYPLYPLLLIECKEGRWNEGAKDQVLGYNHFVGALYVALSGENLVELIHPQSLSFLPPYSQLLENICKSPCQ